MSNRVQTPAAPVTLDEPIFTVLHERARVHADGLEPGARTVVQIDWDAARRHVMARVGPEAFLVLVEVAVSAEWSPDGQLLASRSAEAIAQSLTDGRPHRGWRRQQVSRHLDSLVEAGLLVDRSQQRTRRHDGSVFARTVLRLNPRLYRCTNGPLSRSRDRLLDDAKRDVEPRDDTAQGRLLDDEHLVAANLDDAKRDVEPNQHEHLDDAKRDVEDRLTLRVTDDLEDSSVSGPDEPPTPPVSELRATLHSWRFTDPDGFLANHDLRLVAAWMDYIATHPGHVQDPPAYLNAMVRRGQWPPRPSSPPPAPPAPPSHQAARGSPVDDTPERPLEDASPEPLRPEAVAALADVSLSRLRELLGECRAEQRQRLAAQAALRANAWMEAVWPNPGSRQIAWYELRERVWAQAAAALLDAAPELPACEPAVRAAP